MSDEIITNRTNAYLKFHADAERDPLPPGVSVRSYLGGLIESIADGSLQNVKFRPDMTLEEIGHICRGLSTPDNIVYARAEWVDGKLVVALHSAPAPQGLDALLHPGSAAPLSLMAVRQAS